MRRVQLLLLTICFPALLQAQSLYGDMEVWRNYKVGADTVWNPSHWFSYDSLTLKVGPTVFVGATFVKQTYQTTDAHSGSYAAKVVSRQQDTIGVAPGVLVNAYPTFDPAKFTTSNPYAAISYTGGTAITVRPATLTAWLKYLPQGSDVGEAYVEVHAMVGTKDSVIGTGYESITASSVYSDLTVSIAYTASTATPQKVIVIFSSSSGLSGTDGSTLYIDDVTMSYVAVPRVEKEGDIVTCYPNPGNGQVNLTGPAGKKLQWLLYNVNGQQVANSTFTAQSKLDLSYLSSGVYLYDVLDEAGIILQRGKLGIN